MRIELHCWELENFEVEHVDEEDETVSDYGVGIIGNDQGNEQVHLEVGSGGH